MTWLEGQSGLRLGAEGCQCPRLEKHSAFHDPGSDCLLKILHPRHFSCFDWPWPQGRRPRTKTQTLRCLVHCSLCCTSLCGIIFHSSARQAPEGPSLFSLALCLYLFRVLIVVSRFHRWEGRLPDPLCQECPRQCRTPQVPNKEAREEAPFLEVCP